jgi:hypothetical protein
MVQNSSPSQSAGFLGIRPDLVGGDLTRQAVDVQSPIGNPRSRSLDPVLSARYIESSLPPLLSLNVNPSKLRSQNKITIALGFFENDHNSLYVSQCTIGETGELVMRRRKLMPTLVEQTIFGNCTGKRLDNVVLASVGNVGQLAYWKHVQPLLKFIPSRSEWRCMSQLGRLCMRWRTRGSCGQ